LNIISLVQWSAEFDSARAAAYRVVVIIEQLVYSTPGISDPSRRRIRHLHSDLAWVYGG
jgi:hypothetical protein